MCQLHFLHRMNCVELSGFDEKNEKSLAICKPSI